jgi:hypothetical protein
MKTPAGLTGTLRAVQRLEVLKALGADPALARLTRQAGQLLGNVEERREAEG